MFVTEPMCPFRILLIALGVFASLYHLLANKNMQYTRQGGDDETEEELRSPTSVATK